MGIYSPGQSRIDEDLECSERDLIEATKLGMLYDDMAMMTYEQKQMFINSDEFRALEEAAVTKKTSSIGANTIVKLSKEDDIERRIGQASLNIAREKNDILWVKLMKNRMQEKKLLQQIKKKYNTPAEKVAKQAQKEYIKTHKIAIGFMRK